MTLRKSGLLKTVKKSKTALRTAKSKTVQAKAAPERPKRDKNSAFIKQLLTRREILSQSLSQSTQDMINDEPFYADSVDQAAADADRTSQLRLKDRDVPRVQPASTGSESASFTLTQRWNSGWQSATTVRSTPLHATPMATR